MKLTEAKLKQLILEVITEVDDYYDPQFRPPSKEKEAIMKSRSKTADVPMERRFPVPVVQTVADFFKSMDIFETEYAESKGIKSLIQAGLGLFGPVGAITNADDAADGLKNLIRVTNDNAANLTMEEAEFPLLAFIDLDPELEKTFPTLISNWLKQLNTQIDSLGLSMDSPMPNADDLFLDWVETTEWGCIAPAAREKISNADKDYERHRRSFNWKQKEKARRQSADILDKTANYSSLYKTIKSRSSE